MENFPLSFFGGMGLFALLIVGFLLFITVKAHSRLEIEQGKTPLYKSTSGGRIGWGNYRGPFINLRIYNEFLVISYAKTIVFKYGEIDRVEIKKWMGMVADGIQIIHHKSDVPRRIIIGTTNPDQVKEIIDANFIQPELPK